MTVLDFLVLTLAAAGLVDVWRNGSLFEPVRTYLEQTFEAGRGTRPQPQNWWQQRIYRLPLWAVDLLTCSFCLSHHTPYLLALLCFFPGLLLQLGGHSIWAWIFKLPCYSLAATRLGNLVNAWVPEEARYDSP